MSLNILKKIQRSIQLGNRKTRFIGKETGESQSEKKSTSNSQEMSSFYDRMKNGLGVASTGAWKAADTVLKATTVGLGHTRSLGPRRSLTVERFRHGADSQGK